MSRPATESGPFQRCPACGRAVVPSVVACPRCGAAARAERWLEATRAHPIAPEEENGGICLECGGPVMIRGPFPLRFGSFARLLTSLVAMLAIVLSDLPARWFVLAIFAVASLIPLLAFFPVGRALFRSTLVVCDGCGRIRITGGGASEVRWLRALRSGTEIVYRPLLLSLVFLVVVNLYAFVAGSVTRSGSVLATAVLATLLVCLQTVRENLCPDPRPWWKLV